MSRYLFVLVLLIAATTSAFAQKVTNEFDEAVDFKKFKTFAIRGGDIRSPSPALNSELTKKRLENEIEKALVARGLTKATGPRADLGVSYSLGSLRTVETQTFPAGWRGRGPRTVTTPNTEGTMVIDLRDAATRQLVWRTIAEEDEPNPSKLAEKLDDMVKKSIAKYPPKK